MTRRVGIVSDNSGLYVALSLRGDGLEFTRTTDVAVLAGHDVAVLDVPEGHDVVALAADVPDGPVLVLLTDDDTPVEGATVVPRPYAVGDLLELLRTVTPADNAPPPATTEVLFTAAVAPRRSSLEATALDAPGGEGTDGGPDALHAFADPVIVLDDGAQSDPNELEPPDPDAGTNPDRASPVPLLDAPVRWESRPTAPGLAEGAVATIERTATAEQASIRVSEGVPDLLDLGSDDPIVHVRQLAQALTQALGKAEFLGSMGVLADRLAASIAREHDTDHLALWHRAQDSYVIFGAVGLTSVARRDIVTADHPAIVEAQSQGGLLVEDLTHRAARTRSLPGARSPRYGCVLLDQPAIPIHLVTVSGQRVDYDQLVAISEVIAEAAEAWAAVVAVEGLRRALGMA